MKLNRFFVSVLVTAALALSGAGLASANPSESVPSTSGFVDKAVTRPSCDDPALTFSGRYVGTGANLRLERKVGIAAGVSAWIPVSNEGVAVYKNGRPISGFGRPVEDGHVTVEYGDTFEVSQHATDGLTRVYRLQVLLKNNEFTEFDEKVVMFPRYDLCLQLENNELSAAP